MSKQPEALRLADVLERMPLGEVDGKASAELRRQHALIEELRKLLGELAALVRFECPGLMNEDFGGNGVLSIQIDEALAKAEAQQ